MKYSFNDYSYTLNFNNIPDNCFMALYERGTIVSPYSSYDSNTGFLHNKVMLDYYVSNTSRGNFDNYGLFYGYCYHHNDSLTINFNNNITYFTLSNIGSNMTYFSSITVIEPYDSSQTSWGVNGQFISPHTYFNDSSFGSLSNLVNENDTSEYQDIYSDTIYPVNSPNSYNVLFDYRLATNNETYYIRGEDYNFYCSYFEIDNEYDSTYLIHVGYDNSLNAEYERGYGNGLQSGTVQGRQEGYRNGLSDGIAQGRLEVGNYSGAMDFVGNGITQLMPVFGLEVLPNISLGTIISIPIIVGILSIVFHISRG